MRRYGKHSENFQKSLVLPDVPSGDSSNPASQYAAQSSPFKYARWGQAQTMIYWLPRLFLLAFVLLTLLALVELS